MTQKAPGMRDGALESDGRLTLDLGKLVRIIVPPVGVEPTPGPF